jgi:DNA-binding SARP family transcriptional activator
LELHQVELSQVRLGSYEQAFFNLERGQCLLELGRNSEALESLASAADLFSEGGNLVEESLARFWHAAVLSLTDLKTAVASLHRYLPPQREWRIPTPLMLQSGRIALWLKSIKQVRLLRDPGLRVFFEHALRVLDDLPDLLQTFTASEVSASLQVPRLDIHTFGQIQIYNHGRLLQIADWQTREARDLFLYLLQSPRRSKEQIAADFWPDLPPARIKMRFKINIYRIRRALGQDAILFQDDQYAFNRSLVYTWDRERLETYYQRIAQARDPMERISNLESALEILRAGYLNDIPSEWASMEHSRFGEQLRRRLLELAELRLQQGNGEGCLGLAREVLGLEPLLESAHRLSLQAYAVQHDPAGLASQYQQYREILENEMGMLPSLEMRTLYEKLMNTL